MKPPKTKTTRRGTPGKAGPQTKRRLTPLAVEMAAADLGDARRSQRLGKIVSGLMADPSASLPKAMGDDAGLEGVYRFLGNEEITPDRILSPHIDATCFRASVAGDVLAIHDTTECQFGGTVTREGLGRTSGPTAGFFAHVALLVSAEGHRRPLGVAGLHTHVRGAPKTKEQRQATKRSAQPDSEAQRWPRLMDEVSERLAKRARVTHVADREGDSYGLLSHLAQANQRFVIRVSHNRSVGAPDGLTPPRKLFETVAAAPSRLEREVHLSPRKKAATPKERRLHPPREARMATLAFAATTVEIKRSQYVRQNGPRTMRLNVVRVFEPHPPEGAEPVEWILWTNLPVDTADEIAIVVDIYRARWLIEEYFKALKTGCQYENRQLESGHSLINLLAVLAPIAWHLLRLRSLARTEPTAPASVALTPTQLDVLAAIAKRPLPRNPTVRDAMLAVAALGGHIKNNGEPGWMVLNRGFRDLLLAEIGWSARRRMEM